MSTLRDADDAPIILDPAPLPLGNPLVPHTTEDLARISEAHTDVGQEFDDEADTGRSVPQQFRCAISVICVCLISSSELPFRMREYSYECLIIGCFGNVQDCDVFS